LARPVYHKILVAYAKTFFGMLLLTGVEASLRSDSDNVRNLALGMETEYADAAIRHFNIILESGFVLPLVPYIAATWRYRRRPVRVL
jgi:hypothetical protein